MQSQQGVLGPRLKPDVFPALEKAQSKPNMSLALVYRSMLAVDVSYE
jgi:hypothetical protein